MEKLGFGSEVHSCSSLAHCRQRRRRGEEETLFFSPFFRPSRETRTEQGIWQIFFKEKNTNYFFPNIFTYSVLKSFFVEVFVKSCVHPQFIFHTHTLPFPPPYFLFSLRTKWKYDDDLGKKRFWFLCCWLGPAAPYNGAGRRWFSLIVPFFSLSAVFILLHDREIIMVFLGGVVCGASPII